MTATIHTAAPACHNAMTVIVQPSGRTKKSVGSVLVRMNVAAKNNEIDDLPALLAAVGKDRDVDAFEALFRYFAPRIRSYMARQVRDRQAAEELMQETMMMVWNKAALYDPTKGNAEAWIFTIARNLRISAYRKLKRPEFDPNDPAFVPDDELPADHGYEQKQEAERLHRAMKKLPPEQLELLKHSFFDETPHSAIAEALGIPLGTVKSRIRMAFAKLRVALEDRS